MNPQYPANEPAAPGQNSYDFFLNPQQAPKQRRGLPGSGKHIVGQLTIIIGLALVVMLVLGVVASMIGGSKTNEADLVKLTQTQNELVRIASAGTHDAINQTTKNLAVTTQLTLTTQQQELLTFLRKHGRKVDTKELAFTQSATTDLRLKSAKQTSTYDVVFTQIIQSDLQSYSNTLKTLFGKSKNAAERDILSTDYTQTQLLLSQVPVRVSSESE